MEEVNPKHKIFLDAEEAERRRLERLYGPKQDDFGENETDQEIQEFLENPAENGDHKLENTNLKEADDVPDCREESAETTFPSRKLNLINKLILLVVNPFVIPTILTLLIFRLSILKLFGDRMTTSNTLIVLFATCVIPLLLTYLLIRGGVVKSLFFKEREERICPYIIECFAFGGLAWFFGSIGLFPWMWLIFIGMTACCLMNLIINFRFKISNQASALAASIAVFLIINNDGMTHPDLLWWIIGSIFLLGISGFMSILTDRHNILEILSGYATGFLGVYLFSLAAN